MIRKFKFEDEIYNSLSCLPMAARRKLDQLGLKIGFDQWQQLSRGERLMICHAPIASEDETEALRTFVTRRDDGKVRRHSRKSCRRRSARA